MTPRCSCGNSCRPQRAAAGCSTSRGALREPIKIGESWQTIERLQAIRLLGRQPIQVAHDRAIADFPGNAGLVAGGAGFVARPAERRAGRGFEAFVQRVMSRWPDLIRVDDPIRRPKVSARPGR